MLIRYLVLLGTLSLSAMTMAVDVDTFPAEPPIADKLSAKLLHASKTPGSPFHLQVNCTDQKGIRSLLLYSGGVAVWNRRSQIMLPELARAGLLKTLIDQDFVKFEDSYGGREQPAKSAAAARVSCRTRIEVEDAYKEVVQLYGGEPSSRLTMLAAELLDQAERYAAGAVTPTSLQDALGKLSTGQLAAETLHLRFVDLPGRDGTGPGSIMFIKGAEVTHRTYSPGKVNTKQEPQAIGRLAFGQLVLALQDANFVDLPGNLWSECQLEVEVEVLTHRKVVLARRFTRLDSKTAVREQQGFNDLLIVLRELGH